MPRPDLDRRINELWDEIPASFGASRAERLLELAHCMYETDRRAETVAMLETAEELFGEAGDDHGVGRAAHNRACALGRLHRTSERDEAERTSIAAFDRAGRPDLAGCSRMALAQYLRAGGHLKQSLAVLLVADANFATAGEDGHRASARVAILDARVDLGQFAAAERALRPALEAATTYAPVPEVARLHELAARIHEVRSGPGAAIAASRRARAVWDALDEEANVAACDIHIAILTIAVDPATAAKALRRFRAERKVMSDGAGVAACDHGLGLVAAGRGRHAKALRRFEEAATVFEAYGLFGPATDSRTSAAEALAALGRDNDALALLSQVIPAAVRFHRPLVELRARLLAAELLLEQGDFGAGAREARKAGTIARRAANQRDLERAQALRRQAEAPVSSRQPSPGPHPSRSKT